MSGESEAREVLAHFTEAPEGRAREAAERALRSPLIDTEIVGARGILLSDVSFDFVRSEIALLDDESALASLNGDLDGEPISEPNFLRFKAGVRRKSWNKNAKKGWESAGQATVWMAYVGAGIREEVEAVQRELAELEAAQPDAADPERIAELRAELERLERRRRLIAFVDPIDIRFNRFDLQPVPNANAVMFCLMDVSGSMGEREKDLAKRFFALLYIFLFFLVPFAGGILRNVLGRKLGSLATAGAVGGVALLFTSSVAMAAVAGTPPKNGMIALPMPCAINS